MMAKWSALTRKITGFLPSRSPQASASVSVVQSQSSLPLQCPRSVDSLKDALGIYPNSEADRALQHPDKASLRYGLRELADQMLEADFWYENGEYKKAQASQAAAFGLFKTQITPHVVPNDTHYCASDYTGVPMIFICKVAPFFVRHGNESVAVAIANLSTNLIEQAGLPSIELAMHATRWRQFVGKLQHEESKIRTITFMEETGVSDFHISIQDAKKNAGLPINIPARRLGMHKGNLFVLKP